MGQELEKRNRVPQPSLDIVNIHKLLELSRIFFKEFSTFFNLESKKIELIRPVFLNSSITGLDKEERRKKYIKKDERRKTEES